MREDLVADLELFLVPASTCVGLPPILLPHPVDCRYFIQCAQSVTTVLSCGQNFCFNVTSQQCDILATALSRDIKYCTDTHTPFAPHGDMCATFVQCGPDKESVRFCPEGELYATSDLCTADINQSYCYNKTLHARYLCGGQGVV
ncbi:peritrophin-1-like [Physella acuta]|uniref:peritrophin-1-like n=1 Tax=Physella acuta TaxID=109671 RepID=UPI0027DE7CF9|nr:peritrophin-1-like [Physella acuta]